MIIPLSADEYHQLRLAGTKFSGLFTVFSTILSLAEGKTNVSDYFMKGPCGNLVTDQTGNQYCGDYENRPQACRNTKEGGKTCDSLRSLHRSRTNQP